MGYQYQREKEYKIELLNLRLQNHNKQLVGIINNMSDTTLYNNAVSDYLSRLTDEKPRITIITLQGDVLYDSDSPDLQEVGNHSNRPEILKAIKTGIGYDVRRTSETIGKAYFYSATRCNSFIVRSALPYDINLTETLSADPHYLWFTFFVSLILIVIFYTFTSKLATSINQLREFAQRADKNEPIELELQSAFPHNELGEISQHIIQIYHRLRRTKEALYIEREKLITHLQTSREGLGVFTKEKKEILVNNLFTQYSNLLSDKNLESTEEIFTVDELQPITRFIEKTQQQSLLADKEEKRHSIHINKHGRVFAIECTIFQDRSFEISINDITQEEEQITLKRQLTQNIAHELKTPLSSIQGYLETVITGGSNLTEERKQAFLERCYAQSNRLTRLLRDISVLTRMDEASNMIDMEKVDINMLISGMLNEVTLELEEKDITVEKQLKPELIVQGDYSLIYSIFRNLTDNVIAYAGTNITIRINCFREDEQFYYFSFADTGTGVSSEHLSRLFERFYRVDKGRSRKLGGTGLGLAIVKNAIVIHGGTISAKNSPEGGLEFIFTLAKKDRNVTGNKLSYPLA